MNLLVNSKSLSSHNFDELKAFKDELSFINNVKIPYDTMHIIGVKIYIGGC